MKWMPSVLHYEIQAVPLYPFHALIEVAPVAPQVLHLSESIVGFQMFFPLVDTVYRALALTERAFSKNNQHLLHISNATKWPQPLELCHSFVPCPLSL